MSIITHKNREVKHCPPHFIKIEVKERKRGIDSLTIFDAEGEAEVEKAIRNWLHENVENRFYIGTHTEPDSGFLLEYFVVAFENEADATYFTLLLPKFLED